MGYLAPKYTTVCRLTEKSDVYAFGIILLQLLTRETRINSSSIRPPVQSGRPDEFIDINVVKKYSKHEGSHLACIALDCTGEVVAQRPPISVVLQKLARIDDEEQ